MAKHVSVTNVGTDGQVLVRDSTQSTGFKFADVAINNTPVDLTTDQSIGGAKNFTNVLIASGTFSAQTDLSPFPTLTYKLGDSTHYYTGAFVQRVTLNSTAYIDGSAAGVLNVVGALKIATGAANGYVLTSDASGNAAWQQGAFVDLTSAQTVGGNKTYTGNNVYSGSTLFNSALPLLTQSASSTLQFATIGMRSYFATASFGNNAGVNVGVSIVDGSATQTKFAIDKYSYNNAYVGNLMAIDINGNATSFNTSVFPANNNSQNLGLSTNYWGSFYSTQINVNSTASISGSSAGVLQVVGDLRMTTAGTNVSSPLTLGGTQTVTNKNLTSGTNTFPTFNQDTTGNAFSASGLKNATSVVLTTSATAPTSGQALIATSSTTATWQTLPTYMSASTYDPAAIAQQVVGLTATQTITNKTLTAPVINNPSGFLTGAAKITVGLTAPSSPSTGDVWVDTN